jgi:hypothetical protein
MERILCAAIHYRDEPTPIHSVTNVKGLVLCGFRHYLIIAQYFIFKGPTSVVDHEQGFLTSKNRFVSRTEAALIAFNAKQTTELKRKLFSEDLY